MQNIPSRKRAARAQRSPRRRTFFCSLKANERTTGPWALPPPFQMGERIDPWRARPVPFWRHGFFPPPETIERVLAGREITRRLARCQSTTRWRMSTRTSCLKIAVARSISPTCSFVCRSSTGCLKNVVATLSRRRRSSARLATTRGAGTGGGCSAGSTKGIPAPGVANGRRCTAWRGVAHNALPHNVAPAAPIGRCARGTAADGAGAGGSPRAASARGATVAAGRRLREAGPRNDITAERRPESGIPPRSAVLRLALAGSVRWGRLSCPHHFWRRGHWSFFGLQFDCGRIDPGGKRAPYRTALIEGGGISTHEGRNDAFHAHTPSLCPRRGPSCWIYLPLSSPRAPPVFE